MMLEVFLKLMTHGQCHSIDNGTVSTRDYDVKHWALSQSKVKGLHSSFLVDCFFAVLMIKSL